jgi:peptidoglycan/LPS O-acetylase OafA/YrhL
MRRTLGYNPALDGLRAAAVAAVIADHSGWGVVGTYGVVIFFVISGYLITGLLLVERESTGRLAVGAFYRRRFARLAPALILVLGVTVAWVLAIGLSVRNWIAGLVGALTYTTDLIEQSSLQPHISTYFEWSWSLAIEEQFYLVWPVLLVVLLSFGRRLGRGLLVGFAVCVVGLAWFSRAQLLAAHASTQTIGFAFRTHMDAIALGAIIAVVTAGRSFSPLVRRLSGPVGGAAALALGLMLFDRLPALFGDDARGYGQVALLCAVLVATLVIGPSGRLGRAFGCAPLVHLGRLSYGLYLWNMLFMNGFHQLFGLKPVHAGWAGVVWLAALLAVCEASYRWVETPLRRRLARRRPVPEPSATATTALPEAVPAG